VVAAARAAQRLVPRRAVPRTDIEEIELGIVGHRIPYRAAAAEPPPFAVPGLGGHGHRVALEALCRIAGHGEESPCELAGLRIERGDVAAHAVLGTAVADDDSTFDDARRACDRIGHVARDERVGLPRERAGCR